MKQKTENRLSPVIIRNEMLSGIVVAIALIPETVGFAIAAGLSPMVGLYASLCILIVTSLFGGRTGMVSGGAGSMAMVFAALVASHGVQYMLLATMLAGVIQIVFGVCKLGNFIKFIPRPVMVGFVNALAIMIFKSQLGYFSELDPIMFVLVGIGIAIIYLFPKINKMIPPALITVVVLTIVTIAAGMDVMTIGSIGQIPDSLPQFALPHVPLTLGTFRTVLPYSFSLAVVGLVESILTAQMLDNLLDENSNKNKECIGQGLANIATSCFGGMAGCGMIGQTVINYKSGGRRRISTFTGGIVMLVLILFFNKLVMRIPIAALVAVMITVSIATFDWQTFKRLKMVPVSDTVVMLLTVVIVLATDNLAYGVIAGTVLSALIFAFKISDVSVDSEKAGDVVTYHCRGQLFFASADSLKKMFDFEPEPGVKIILDVKNLRFWDESALEAIDKIMGRFRNKGVEIELQGLSEKNQKLLEQGSFEYAIMRRNWPERT